MSAQTAQDIPFSELIEVMDADTHCATCGSSIGSFGYFRDGEMYHDECEIPPEIGACSQCGIALYEGDRYDTYDGHMLCLSGDCQAWIRMKAGVLE
jgi:hypothetical protein